MRSINNREHQYQMAAQWADTIKGAKTMNPSEPPTRHLTIQDLAERLGVKVQTIRHWRVRGEGPRSFSPGGHLVRYRLEDVEEWEREQLEASA